MEVKGEGHTQHDQPLGFLHAVRIGLGVSQGFPFGVFGFFDFVFGAVADEDRFTSPFDDDLSSDLHERRFLFWD